MQTTIAPSEPAMDICSGPEGVSASARTPPAQKVAGAESNEAARAGAARRVGAAVRLVLDGITESAQALETPTESMEGVVSPSDGEGHASAQIGPQGAFRVGRMNLHEYFGSSCRAKFILFR